MPVRKADTNGQQRSNPEDSANGELTVLVQTLKQRVRELEKERSESDGNRAESSRNVASPPTSVRHINGYSTRLDVKGKGIEEIPEASPSRPRPNETSQLSQPRPQRDRPNFRPFASRDSVHINKRFATNQVNLYQRPRFLRRRCLYLGRRQGIPLHALAYHRYRRPHFTLYNYLNTAQTVATYERVTPAQAYVWSSYMLHALTHPYITTTRNPQGSHWGIAVADPHRPQVYTDLYEWRLALIQPEACRELNIERGGWQLWRKHRVAYPDQADMARKVVIERPEEVVAIAGWPKLPAGFGRKMLLPWTTAPEQNRLFTLRFEGRGCTGELGDGWEVLAIVTWLGLWHQI